VYDPARDDVATRTYGLRLGIIVITVLAIAAALMPAVTGFTAGPDSTTACVAARDVWHRAPADTPSCVGESRHRIFLTAIGLGAIGLVGFTTFVAGATRRRRREPAAA
jgi:hypothetical protein